MPTNSSGDGLRLALVAHDAKKNQLIEWVHDHVNILQMSELKEQFH